MLSQIANQILQKEPRDLRCHSRAWKVNLIGEGADDAGGVFDETIAQMCEVSSSKAKCLTDATVAFYFSGRV